MKKDPIVQIGAEVLRKKAAPVAEKEFGSRALAATIKKMKDALKKEEFGVAIAAPQIGVAQRIFVVAGRAFDSEKKNEVNPDPEPGKDMVFINPELLRLSRAAREMSEGCLSVRGKYGTVRRHERASVKARDAQGKAFTYHGSGLIAHIFQHETDHLEGILYVDKAVTLAEDTGGEKAKNKIRRSLTKHE